LNNDECNEVFDTLIKYLQEQGLGWVESEVREHIRLGKTVEKERKPSEESSINLFGYLDGYEDQEHLNTEPSPTFPIIVEYTAEERLQLLISAIEQAVVNTAAMEESFTGYFKTEFPQFDSVQFYSEDGTVQPRTINRHSAESRSEKAKRLHQLLEEMRKEI
jgi:hypothetical protein